jgi:hypothetical protein
LNSPDSITFTEAEVQFLDNFGSFISQKARMELTVPEAILLNKYLIEFNRLRNKISEHVFEVRQVIPPPQTGRKK